MCVDSYKRGELCFRHGSFYFIYKLGALFDSQFKGQYCQPTQPTYTVIFLYMCSLNFFLYICILHMYIYSCICIYIAHYIIGRQVAKLFVYCNLLHEYFHTVQFGIGTLLCPSSRGRAMQQAYYMHCLFFLWTKKNHVQAPS